MTAIRLCSGGRGTPMRWLSSTFHREGGLGGLSKTVWTASYQRKIGIQISSPPKPVRPSNSSP